MRSSPLAIAIILLCACSGSGSDPDPAQYGSTPALPEQQRVMVPRMKIAEPAGWGTRRPVAPAGYVVTAIATGLGIPRQALVLPNGDILVAEGRGGRAPSEHEGRIAGKIKRRHHPVPSGKRIPLCRADAAGPDE